MSPTAKRFFTKEEQERIMSAILNAELDTSGEIRVHIESIFKGDVKDRAAFIFNKRNGVLFYVAVKSHKFAILGDVGINKEVPENFWNDIKEKMAEYFKENKFTEGLVFGIRETGAHLKKHFPYHLDDINELSDDISFGK